jgi:hypothetical protein
MSGSSAYKPEYGCNGPFGSERPEILACGRRLDVLHKVRRKALTECIAHSPGRLRILPDKRITVQSRNLRFCLGTRGGQFGIDDPLDRGEHAFPDPLVKSALSGKALSRQRLENYKAYRPFRFLGHIMSACFL